MGSWVSYDKRDYPLDAVREALLNAIVHREYSFSASTIINIFDDRIEFMSLGGLVSGLSIEAIMLGASQSRNEKLANLFYRLKLIEAYGTGIQKILVSYKEFSFKPVFKSETGAFLTTLKNVNYNEQVDVTIESNDIVLNDDYNNILDLLAAGEKSRKEIQDYTNLTQTKCIKMLNKLISIGKIQKIDSGKNTRYKKL